MAWGVVVLTVRCEFFIEAYSSPLNPLNPCQCTSNDTVNLEAFWPTNPAQKKKERDRERERDVHIMYPVCTYA